MPGHIPSPPSNHEAARIARFVFLALVAGLVLPGSVWAEAASTALATPATSDASVTTLDKFIVKGVAAEDQIMPTVRPISSVLGDARSVLDTPRSVSSISKELMEQVRIKSVTDFSQFSPGVYTAARYGLASTPMVRGDLAEIYLNGQRAKYSRNSVMPSFNGVEALDIIKGPGSAVYGPQSNGAAGYTNLVTKQPFFDRSHTELSLSYNALTADRANSNVEWQVDTGGPLSADTAYRISYLGRAGQTYYRNTADDTQDLYAALTHKFSPSLTLQWWVQGSHQVYGEVAGINRVTQALIDDRTYVAGASTYNSANNTYVIANPHLITIPAHDSFVGTDDIAKANRYQTQLMLEKVFSAASSLKNSTYLESRDSSKYQPSIIYSEFVPTDWNLQNRTEYHAAFETGGVGHSVITGVDLKLERLVSYQSFFAEQYNRTDLSQPSSTWSNPVTNIYIFGVPGHTRFGTDVPFGNYGGNQDSKIGDVAAFYQHDVRPTSQLSFIGGGRLDHIHAESQSPEFIDLGGFGSPGTAHRAGEIYHLGTTVNDVSWFLSTLYKLNDTSSAYVTYNRVNALLGSVNFGGIATPDKTEAGFKTALRSRATLFEVGYKVVLLDHTFYNTLAWFRQVRADPDKFGHIRGRIASGVEYEAVYQPNPHFNLLGNFTYQDVFRNGATGIFQLNTDYYKLQPNGSYAATGAGTVVMPYYRRYPGTPNWMANLRASYRFDSGLSFGVGPQATGAQTANPQGTLTIPTQYKLNAVVAYTRRSWDFQVNVDNVTNQHNWTVGDPDFTGNTIIYQEKPLTVGFTVRRRF